MGKGKSSFSKSVPGGFQVVSSRWEQDCDATRPLHSLGHCDSCENSCKSVRLLIKRIPLMSWPGPPWAFSCRTFARVKRRGGKIATYGGAGGSFRRNLRSASDCTKCMTPTDPLKLAENR